MNYSRGMLTDSGGFQMVWPRRFFMGRESFTALSDRRMMPLIVCYSAHRCRCLTWLISPRKA